MSWRARLHEVDLRQQREKEAAECAERYKQVSDDELQKKREDVEATLETLERDFPRWKIQSLSQAHHEIQRLEKERECIILVLTKRGVRKPAPSPPMEGQADQWRDFRNEFMQLSTEEAEIVRAKKEDLYLRAYCTYEEHPEVFEIRKDAAWAFVLFDSTWDQHREKPKVIDKEGENARGPYCLLKTPEYGIWMLSDGVSENFLERFQTLAARAGVALRAPKASERGDVWLHGLFHYLLANRSELLSCAEKGKGGIILRVCEASATFCSRLERIAVTAHSLRADAKQVESSPVQNNDKAAQSEESKSTNAAAIGRNIDVYRKECGWSFEELASKTGIDKKLILSHVNKGARPIPRILREYAQAFSKKLERNVTVSDLEKEPVK